ncbi:hypothetical protein LRAMOSA08982 [Lichtheimia ramosa]|uniref:F-box domain-containing protein n=1 Tax=Lichtheimia ramosa TaxID=688394 RepID=A0A077WH10_9FUNG|nr:hypothetical protein LRAMOSA08982 [Lichtheimia ramosa]
MPYSALSDLCQQPTLAASTEKYKQLVYDSTAELLQPIQCILSALDRRSMALSKCASYDAALRDADIMQQFSPSSAMGYLRAVNIYSEQGKQQQVIDICNKAMHMVDTKDPDYTKLQQAKMDAEQRQNIRIDFIMQLPVEIVFTALIPVLMKENTLKASKPCEYLYVSNQWRDQILQYFGDLQFRIDDEHSVILNRCPQLFQLAQYIKALNISSYTKGSWLVDLIRDYHFSSLRKIEIQLGNGVGLHFISALKLVSSTLTHVEIYLYYGPKFPSDIDLSQVPTMAKLETLVLVNEEGINYDQTIEIYKRFPSLKTLKLAVCSDFESALVVSDYRPSMKCRKVQMTTYCLELSFSGQGVSALTQQNAIVILNKYQGTLQDIYWSIEPDSNDDMYSIQYPQLKKLSLYESGWWILRNAPMLEELDITSKTISKNPAIFNTTPTNLRKLRILLSNGRYLPDKTALARYIYSFSQQSQLQQPRQYARCT